MSGVAISPAADAAMQPHRQRPLWALLIQALGLWRTRIGLLLVAILVLIALLGPVLAPHGATDFVGKPATGPSTDAPFGTDYNGQDVLSRFLRGGGSMLLLAIGSTALGLVLGLAVGLAAAYSRGVLDEVLMRAMDVLLSFPQIMFALLVVAMLGPSALLLIVVVGLTTMPRIARVVRGAALPFVEREFVSSAEAIGASRARILFSELLPNIMSPLVVETTLRLTYSVALIAGLAFLGFTTDPNAPDWGRMIQENQVAVTTQPWGVVLPVIAIAMLTVGTSIVGDGLARAAAGIDRGGPRR